MARKAEARGSETDLIRQVTHLAVGADLDAGRELHRLSQRAATASALIDTDQQVQAWAPSIRELFCIPAQVADGEVLRAGLSRADQVRLEVFADEVRTLAESRQWVGTDHRGESVLVRIQPLVSRGAVDDSLLFVSLVQLQLTDDDESGNRVQEDRLYYRMSQLEIMLGALPTAVLLYERDGEQLLHGNRRAIKLFRLRAPDGTAQFVPIQQADRITVVDDGKRWCLPDWVQRWVDEGGHDERSADTVTLQLDDGDQLDVVDGFAPLYDVSGQVRGCVATLTDITERRRLEREAEVRYRQQAAIADLGLYAMAEPRLDAVLRECCRIAAETLDVELARVLAVSDDTGDLRYSQGVGWSESEVEAYREQAADDLEAGRVLSTGQPIVVDDYGREQTLRAPPLLSGHAVVSSLSVPIRGPRKLYGVLGLHSREASRFTAMDINFVSSVATLISHALYREHYERRLAESRERLARAEADRNLAHAERLTSLGTLAAGIAHEINNPLNSIMMNAELGKMHLQMGAHADKLTETLDRIIEDCRRSARITKSVLSFARRDAERVREPVTADELFANAQQVLASIMHMGSVKLRAEIMPDTPPILGSATELEQILINLAKNSGEAGAHHVDFHAEPAPDGQVCLRIEDDGPGIPEPDQQRVFDPFFSTKRKTGGTGLGLSLVHRIVEDHGGTIGVVTSGSGGCRFEILLPRAGP